MTASLPHRNAGLPWLGEIPSHWEVAKFSRVIDIAEGQVDPEDDRFASMLLVAPNHIESGTGRLLARETAAEQGAISGKYMCFPGDIIYSKIRPALQKAALAPENCLCSADMYPLRPRSGLTSPYLLFLLLSGPFTTWAILESDRVAMPKINRESLNDLRIPVPPVSEQLAIVAFLDREASRIDDLVAAKQRLLDLIAEKRRAIIASAVTRGLNPAALMRDSCVPWLGKIPAHWRDVRVRFLISSLEQGWSPEAENREFGMEEWGVLKLNAVSHGNFDNSAAKALPTNLEPRPELQVEVGDVLVTRANTPSLVGDACYVAQTRPRLMLCDLIYRLRIRPSAIDGRFLTHFLTLPMARAQIETAARGASGSMVKISQDHIKDWRVSVPPLEEQRTIVDHIDRETAKLDKVRAATALTISLLKERRAALIAAAVTGQICVGAAS